MDYPRARLFSTRRRRKATVLASHSRAIFANAKKKQTDRKEDGEPNTKKKNEDAKHKLELSENSRKKESGTHTHP